MHGRNFLVMDTLRMDPRDAEEITRQMLLNSVDAWWSQYRSLNRGRLCGVRGGSRQSANLGNPCAHHARRKAKSKNLRPIWFQGIHLLECWQGPNLPSKPQFVAASRNRSTHKKPSDPARNLPFGRRAVQTELDQLAPRCASPPRCVDLGCA